MPNQYDDLYSCLQAGYAESITKTEEIGQIDINEYKIFIKFFCKETEVEGINA